ncbi:intradiol ring-cleavage dioxygenase [Pseudooceanicola sp. LIPI14-2-Ac024]|uniref:intradiol ring-cleavage dioxygenase n=1 Tax=Pseudooceanicola sp. LIPI14-2-Ac024 TaxID=3344875 RepID=UPI0035D0F3D5
MSSTPISRRLLLATLAATPLVTTGIGAFPSATRAEAAGAGLITPNVCILSPETTEGPYYLDRGLVRQDIREDRDGAAMTLALQVVRPDCTPVEGARVDLWHCDAAGDYSGVSGDDGTFLRGIQHTDDTGVARFQTIYPGWYPGRATHAHYMVHLGDTRVLTSQVFFPQALSAYLYRSVTPYDERPRPDTTNGADRIARRAGDGAFAAVREMPEGYHAALVVGVAG